MYKRSLNGYNFEQVTKEPTRYIFMTLMAKPTFSLITNSSQKLCKSRFCLESSLFLLYTADITVVNCHIQMFVDDTQLHQFSTGNVVQATGVINNNLANINMLSIIIYI